MKKPGGRRPLLGDDKVENIVIRGKTATKWRALLRTEGGTNQHHGLCAIELYIKHKGYDTEPSLAK